MIAAQPKPGPPRSVPLPHAHEMLLANGMRVIVFSRAETPGALHIPLVSALIAFDCGAVSDPPRLAGVAATTSALLRQGTRRHTALELDLAVDALGARIDRSASYDVSTAGVTATSAVFAEAFDLVAEIVREPTFLDEEFERVRTRALSDLRLSYSSPAVLARLVAGRVIAGESPYGHPIAGTPRSLEALRRDDVLAFASKGYRPDRATLLIGGDVTVEQAFDLAHRTFGDWTAPPDRAEHPIATSLPPPRKRVVAIDKPDAGRTAVIVTHAGPARGAIDYYAGVVTTAVLSGYSGRLNAEVRVKRGLSYGAGAQLYARHGAGQFVAATLVDHKRALETVDVMLETLASIELAPPDDRELAARKASLLGSWSRAIETNDGLLGALADLALYGIPLEELNRYPDRVEAQGAAQLAAFARSYVRTDPAIVLVGDTRVYGDRLPALAADVRVVPFAELDLETLA